MLQDVSIRKCAAYASEGQLRCTILSRVPKVVRILCESYELRLFDRREVRWKGMRNVGLQLRQCALQGKGLGEMKPVH
jgi:hypothetical protein